MGTVLKRSSDKTVSVLVSRRIKHPVYGKIVNVSKKYLVHDPYNTVEVGSVIQIVSCRPISKTKSWRVVYDEKTVDETRKKAEKAEKLKKVSKAPVAKKKDTDSKDTKKTTKTTAAKKAKPKTEVAKKVETSAKEKA